MGKESFDNVFSQNIGKNELINYIDQTIPEFFYKHIDKKLYKVLGSILKDMLNAEDEDKYSLEIIIDDLLTINKALREQLIAVDDNVDLVSDINCSDSSSTESDNYDSINPDSSGSVSPEPGPLTRGRSLSC